LERICNDAGFATTHKRVLTSEGNRCADLEIRNIGQTDLLVDVTLRHHFIGAGQIGQNQGQLRNQDHPERILESAAADKICNYRDTYRRNGSATRTVDPTFVPGVRRALRHGISRRLCSGMVD
jgi:hypothetical protein